MSFCHLNVLANNLEAILSARDIYTGDRNKIGELAGVMILQELNHRQHSIRVNQDF